MNACARERGEKKERHQAREKEAVEWQKVAQYGSAVKTFALDHGDRLGGESVQQLQRLQKQSAELNMLFQIAPELALLSQCLFQ